MDKYDDYPILDAKPGEVRTTSSTGGQKGTKVERYDLIPVVPLRTVAEHYGIGAEKYDDRNWEKGYEWSKSYAALQRHAQAFWGGEDIDGENGQPHLAAVVFHAFALLEYGFTHPEFDDRPKGANPNPSRTPQAGVIDVIEHNAPQWSYTDDN